MGKPHAWETACRRLKAVHGICQRPGQPLGAGQGAGLHVAGLRQPPPVLDALRRHTKRVADHWLIAHARPAKLRNHSQVSTCNCGSLAVTL